MQKAKVALVEAGIIKTAGRGRISAEGHAWLKAQHDNGTRFSDWPKGEVKVTKTEATAEKPAESKVKVIRSSADTSVKTVAELPTYRYTVEEFEAVEPSGKKRTVKEVCKNSQGVSLVICYVCADDAHRIVKTDGSGDVTVTVKRK